MNSNVAKKGVTVVKAVFGAEEFEGYYECGLVSDAISEIKKIIFRALYVYFDQEYDWRSDYGYYGRDYDDNEDFEIEFTRDEIGEWFDLDSDDEDYIRETICIALQYFFEGPDDSDEEDEDEEEGSMMRNYYEACDRASELYPIR